MRYYLSVITLLATLLALLGCGAAQHLSTNVNTQVKTVVKDSLVIRTDTVVIQIPIESHSSVAKQYSKLETTVAWSDAEVDTLGLLHHRLFNKPTELKKEVIYLDRLKTEYRDSIQVKEVPVEVEVIRKVVPNLVWYLLVFNVLVLLILGVRLYFKLKT